MLNRAPTTATPPAPSPDKTGNTRWKRVTGMTCFLLCLCGHHLPVWAFQARISLGTEEGRPANRNLLGNNVQWVDQGDGLVDQHGALNRSRIKPFEPHGIPALRFPGGSLSDSYHWKDGVGGVSKRPTGRDLSNRQKPNVFGTDEFLQLARHLGAMPVITANVASGTADEAAAWVRYSKEAAESRGLAKVRFWEIGNEPYLKEAQRPDLALAPQAFIRRFNTFAAAMRSADPSIKIGLPLRTDQINGVPVSAYPGYNQTVLTGLSVPIDFAALHYYFPFANDKAYSDTDLYWATMAAPEVMRQDLVRTRTEIVRHLKTDIPIAITEYNALFTLGRPATDGHINTLGAALLIADMLRVFAETPGIIFANYWSMSGNWHFGMTGPDATPRPSYHVYTLYSSLLQGHHLPAKVESPTFDCRSVGLIPTTTGLPLVTAIATRHHRTTRLLVINKSLTDTAEIEIDTPTPLGDETINARILSGPSPLTGHANHPPIETRHLQSAPREGKRMLTLPAHAIALLEFSPAQ